MADEEVLDDDDAPSEDPSELVRHLRSELKAREKVAREAEAAKRELAFLKAGIDTDSKLGRLFAKSFEGDLSDVEAIKAEAVELGIIKAPETTSEPAAPPDTSATERSALASGAAPDDGQGVDPRTESRSIFERAMQDGMPWEQAAGLALNAKVNRVMNGTGDSVIIRGNAF